MQSATMPVPATVQISTHCITEEDLRQDPQAMLGEQPQAKSCDVGAFEFRNGEVNIEMTCTAEGGEMIMRSQGTYHATSYDMRSKVEMRFGGMSMIMESTSAGLRIGECTD